MRLFQTKVQGEKAYKNVVVRIEEHRLAGRSDEATRLRDELTRADEIALPAACSSQTASFVITQAATAGKVTTAGESRNVPFLGGLERGNDDGVRGAASRTSDAAETADRGGNTFEGRQNGRGAFGAAAPDPGGTYNPGSSVGTVGKRRHDTGASSTWPSVCGQAPGPNSSGNAESGSQSGGRAVVAGGGQAGQRIGSAPGVTNAGQSVSAAAGSTLEESASRAQAAASGPSTNPAPGVNAMGRPQQAAGAASASLGGGSVGESLRGRGGQGQRRGGGQRRRTVRGECCRIT
jgi:hypothetical protein